MESLSEGARLRAENTVLKLVADIADEVPPEGAFFDVECGRWRVVLSVAPAGASVIPIPAAEDPLTACEERCLEALQALSADGDRHQGREVYEWIRKDSRAKSRRGWGWASVAAALANLVARRVLVNPRDKRGYGFPKEDNAA